jgi:kynurenine formamidase
VRVRLTRVLLVATLLQLGCVANRPRPTHIVDLSHTLSPQFPFIPAQGKTFAFRITPIATLAENRVNANKWELTEHNGTHVDAPLHFAANGAAIDQIPIADLFAPAVVIDIRDKVARNQDARLTVADLLRWERAHGRVPDGAALFVYTGWDSRVQNAAAFVNMDSAGVMHFPGIDTATIDFLVTQRRIVGVGIDTLSVDPGVDTKYPAHRGLFAAGKWAVECVASLGRLPTKGATVFLGAVKVAGATGAPARVVAFW